MPPSVTHRGAALIRATPLALAALVATAAVPGCQCRSDVQYVPLTSPPDNPNDHGQWLSMDVAPDGSLAASYYDRTEGGVAFAVGHPQADGTVWWFPEEVDGYPDNQGLDPGDRGWFTSLAIAPSGRAWVAYYDQQNHVLRAAFRENNAWTTEQADVGSGLNADAGQWASLALDASDNPVIAHYDAGAGKLRVARRSADGTWTGEVAYEGTDGTAPDGTPVSASVGQFANLVIHEGVEHIAFYDAAHGDLGLIEGTSGAYTYTAVATEGDVGQWPSLWTDGTQTVIAYHDVGNQNLVVATRTGDGAFTSQVVDTAPYVGADTEIFHDADGIGVVYFDGQFNDMRVARQTGDTWQTEVLGGDGLAVGYHNEAVYADGQWWVGSYDYTHRTLFTQAL